METTSLQQPTISNLSKLSLKLFNVILVDNDIESSDLKLDKTLKHGFILNPIVANKDEDKVNSIIQYLIDNKLTGADLNKTFHKSWRIIQLSTREELLIEQLLHYITTYGFKELGIYSDSTIYIPNEELNVPFVGKLPLTVILPITKDELINKCVDLFRKGIALKEETIDDILFILKELNCKFNSEILDTLKNKEAIVKIASTLGIYPSSPTEFVRFLIYISTQNTMIIKNYETIQKIKISNTDISFYCKQFGLEKLSQVFLRYKPIFLAFKDSNSKNKSTINKLRKLAKKNHVPMKEDYLNNITSSKTYDISELNDNLNKVNNFRKTRLLYALQTRMSDSDVRLYKIRNGKTYVTKVDKETKSFDDVYNIIYRNFIDSLDLKGKDILYPKDIDYALPSSEKMFIGNIPTGTCFNIGGDALFGIYWENSGGGYDLDLSGMDLDTKIGWNSDYRNNNGTLKYSGDNTEAPNGASEFLYASKGLNNPYIITNNIYNGSIGCKMKIIIAKEKTQNYNRNYMVNPNNVIVEIETIMDSKEKTLGLFMPTKDGVKIILTDFGSGNAQVSGYSEVSEMRREFLMTQGTNPILLRKVLEDSGANIIYSDEYVDNIDIDLTPQNLTKDSIINLIS